MPGGRPQERARTGPTYQLAEFMNKNWDTLVGRPNDEVAKELGYKGGNMISMWRTGLTRVSLERLPDVARLMKIDMAVLLPLWFEQSLGARADYKGLANTVFKRLAALREVPVLNAIRKVATEKGVIDPQYDQTQVRAIEAILRDEKLCKEVVTKAEKAGIIGPPTLDDDDDETPLAPINRRGKSTT